MQWMLFFCFLFSFFLYCTDAKLVSPPVYTVNLSLPSQEIWAEVAKDFAPKFPRLFKEIEAKLPKELLREIAAITPDLDKYIFPNFVEEMRGIAKYGNVSLERIVLLNLLYDIHAYDQTDHVPSVHVALNSDRDPNNPIIVGSTFGWVYTSLLRNMTIVVRTKIPARYIICGTTFAGMVGIHSGVVAADFSASYAERKANPNSSWRTIFNLLRTGNYTTLSLQIRYKQQYDVLGQIFLPDAVLDFSNSHLVAPSYLMLGGWDRGQGVIITRDTYAAYDKQFLFSSDTNWYMVGTNSDPWVKPPDRQKKMVMHALDRAGTSFDVSSLLKILENPKLFNNRTVFVTATTPCYWGEYASLVYYPD